MTEATETQVITNWYSPLVQEMWQATLVCMDNYRDEVTKYDIPYLQKQGRPGDRALWLMRDYSSQMQLLDFEPSFFQNPDTLRAYHKQMLFRKELIQKERYDNCYLLTLDDPTVPTGQMQLLQPSTAIALLDKLMAEAPPMPELDRSNTLEICCPEYFAQVVAQAKEMGLEEDLKEKLEYLRNYSDRYWYRCRLYQDFAPMSFTWSGEFKETEDGEWKQMIYAGLIFHQSSQEWGIHS